MKTYRYGYKQNILGDEWLSIQKKTMLGIWVDYIEGLDKEEMDRIAERLEDNGNIVIRYI